MLISGSTHGHKQTCGPGQRWPETLPSELVLEMNIYSLTPEGVTLLWEDSLGVHGLNRASPVSPPLESL